MSVIEGTCMTTVFRHSFYPDNSFSKLVICDGEHTNVQRLLSIVQCLDQLFEVRLRWEEDCTDKDVGSSTATAASLMIVVVVVVVARRCNMGVGFVSISMVVGSI